MTSGVVGTVFMIDGNPNKVMPSANGLEFVPWARSNRRSYIPMLPPNVPLDQMVAHLHRNLYWMGTELFASRCTYMRKQIPIQNTSKAREDRCRRRAVSDYRLCWYHLARVEKLVVAPSRSRFGGKGLYAVDWETLKVHGRSPRGDPRPKPDKVVFKAGDTIAFYGGEILSQAEMEQRYGNAEMRNYLALAQHQWQTHGYNLPFYCADKPDMDGYYIDGFCARTAAWYAKPHSELGVSVPNAEIKKLQSTYMLACIRPIVHGEEICIFHGALQQSRNYLAVVAERIMPFSAEYARDHLGVPLTILYSPGFMRTYESDEAYVKDRNLLKWKSRECKEIELQKDRLKTKLQSVELLQKSNLRELREQIAQCEREKKDVQDECERRIETQRENMEAKIRSLDVYIQSMKRQIEDDYVLKTTVREQLDQARALREELSAVKKKAEDLAQSFKQQLQHKDVECQQKLDRQAMELRLKLKDLQYYEQHFRGLEQEVERLKHALSAAERRVEEEVNRRTQQAFSELQSRFEATVVERHRELVKSFAELVDEFVLVYTLAVFLVLFLFDFVFVFVRQNAPAMDLEGLLRQYTAMVFKQEPIQGIGALEMFQNIYVYVTMNHAHLAHEKLTEFPQLRNVEDVSPVSFSEFAPPLLSQIVVNPMHFLSKMRIQRQLYDTTAPVINELYNATKETIMPTESTEQEEREGEEPTAELIEA